MCILIWYENDMNSLKCFPWLPPLIKVSYALSKQVGERFQNMYVCTSESETRSCKEVSFFVVIVGAYDSDWEKNYWFTAVYSWTFGHESTHQINEIQIFYWFWFKDSHFTVDKIYFIRLYLSEAIPGFTFRLVFIVFLI